jgi:glycosyltransferase involved in cell wall biosynthesis
MHIVIDARIRPSSTGRYVDRLMEHLQKIDKKNRYTILLRPDDLWRPTAKSFTAKACPFKLFTFNPLDQFTYARFLRKLKPDLVHFGMTPQEPVFYFGKRITTTHDLTMFRFTRAGRLPGWLHVVRMIGYRFLFWWSVRVAKRVIVPSNYVSEDLWRHHRFTAKKTVVTYESSEPPRKDKAEKPNGISKPFILHVGSPFPHKNIERLIGAFLLLKKKHPGLTLVLTGKKEYYFEQLQRRVLDSPAKDSVKFTGFVSDPELKWLYENAECYVLPSLSEGFGLPGLEAMSHGCPLVSSNATCLPEIYGEAAHFFHPLSDEDMAAKIDDVLTDKQLRDSLIKKGHSQLKKYSWNRMAKQTLDIYKKVLKA